MLQEPAELRIGFEPGQQIVHHCNDRVGDAYFRTPRTTIKEFVNLLAVLDQNPSIGWVDLVAAVDIPPEANPDLAPVPDDAASVADAPGDELSTFRL